MNVVPANAGLGTDAAAMTSQLLALRAIVDDLDYGIVVLDQDRRVRFMNRAFRRFWRVPDGFAESGLTFVRLMYHGRGAAAYAVRHERLGDYVEKQLDLIRTGEERSLTMRLANGEVLQFKCKALRDGGRLLTYGNVSDLVRQAEALEQLASVDSMTGLNNRRHFRTLAEAEWSRFRRYGRPLALLMIDIDLFKSINDSYGHDIGDEVIKSVAGILQTHKRVSDIVGRLGGEEFALLLPEATLDNAAAAGDRLRQLVAGHAVAVEGRRIPVTISAGASVCDANTSGIDELLKQADVALYEAKRTGRNRVCRFGPVAGDAAEGGAYAPSNCSFASRA
jgi:diguanylate cyclase (GGDEF)-like protein